MAQPIAQKVITMGSDVTLYVRLRNEYDDPFDLTGVTEITAKFANSDQTVLSKTMTDGSVAITSAVLGKISIALTDQETSALKDGQGSFEVYVDKGTDRKIAQFQNALNVVQKLF